MTMMILQRTWQLLLICLLVVGCVVLRIQAVHEEDVTLDATRTIEPITQLEDDQGISSQDKAENKEVTRDKVEDSVGTTLSPLEALPEQQQQQEVEVEALDDVVTSPAISSIPSQSQCRSADINNEATEIPFTTIALTTTSTLALEERNRELESRLARLEALLSQQLQHVPVQPELSLLDISIEETKKYLIRAIPSTDQECRFDWKIFTCTPKCKCRMQFKLGDYSLDRACRLRDSVDVNQCTAESESLEEYRSAVEKIQHAVQENVHKVVQKAKEQAPYSDDICSFNWKNMKCQPEKYCQFDYQVGDYSLNRACRLIVAESKKAIENNDASTHAK